jgi:quercetin dioxygenase-like cupin family protein
MTPDLERKLPVIYKWIEYRRHFRWEPPVEQGQAGGHRAFYPEIGADQLVGQMVLLPTAHSIQAETSAGATVFVGVKGDTAISVGDTTHTLARCDVLTVPADISYSYRNVDLEASLFFRLRGKTLEEAEGTAAILGDWPESSPAPGYFPWDQVKRQFTWQLPRAEQWGMHRGSGPHFYSGIVKGHLVRQPPSQSSPWHALTRDLIFLHLAGEVEFTAAGRIWPMQPMDLLMVPANVPYAYTNVGLTEAIFCDATGRIPTGTSTTYWKVDPGWPVRPDAELLETIAGPEGERREAKPG